MPYHVLYKVFGLHPFILENKMGRRQRSTYAIKYSAGVLALLLISIGNALYNILTLHINYYNKKMVSLKAYYNELILFNLIPALALTSDLFHSNNSYQRMLNLLSHEDFNHLKSCEVRQNSLHNIWQVVQFTDYIAIGVVTQHSDPGVSKCPLMLGDLFTAVVLSRYAKLMFFVLNELRALNECLRATTRQVHPCAVDYRRAGRLYGVVCRLSDEVLSTHQAFLAMLTGMLLFSASVSTFFMLHNIINSHSVTVEPLLLLWVFVQLILVLLPSHLLRCERQVTVSTVCRWLLYSAFTHSNRAELRRLWCVVERNRPNHRLFGFLPLDLSLLTAFFSAYNKCTSTLLSL